MFQTAFYCNIMKTYKISPNYLRFFFDISTIYEAYGYEGCDSEYTKLCSLNFANRNSVRRWVNEYLRPLFQEYSPARQLRIKESFRDGLNFWSDETLRRCADDWLEGTNATSVRQRCREIWNDLFDGEYSGITDAAAYETIETESNDPFNNWNGKKPVG